MMRIFVLAAAAAVAGGQALASPVSAADVDGDKGRRQPVDAGHGRG